MIAILCPTRGRPEQCKYMVDSVRLTSATQINVHLVIDGDDTEYLKFFPDYESHPRINGSQPTSHKWNMLAIEAMKDLENKLFMLGSDDMYFETDGWDKALIDHYNALENKIHVYALRDSRDAMGTPHIIATREYIEAMGYFVPPIFLHWFIDTWTVEIAKANNCFTHLTEYTLVHDKPSDRGMADDTHNRIRDFGWHDRDKYVNDTCGHFLELEKQRLRWALGHAPNISGLENIAIASGYKYK